MKKIIKGKKYDTETAEEIAEYWNGFSISDCRYVKEYLYKKKNGDFFLCGEGSPMTKYSRSVDYNSSIGGEKIILLSIEDAKEWAEENLSIELYEFHFGTCEE